MTKKLLTAAAAFLLIPSLYSCGTHEMAAGGPGGGGGGVEHAEHVHTKGDEFTFYEELEGRAPDFTLVNQDGEEVSLSDWRGKVVVITYIYTHCTYACPLLESKLITLQNTFGERLGKDLILVSMTVDPERDTPEALRAHARLLGADPTGWVFLTGSREDIDKALAAYKIRYTKSKDGEYNHTNSTTIIDREGNLAYRLNGLHYPRKVLVERTKEALGRKE
ncbi:MAG: SCO family protein [Thermodesulfobacteriota bacterium]